MSRNSFRLIISDQSDRVWNDNLNRLEAFNNCLLATGQVDDQSLISDSANGSVKKCNLSQTECGSKFIFLFTSTMQRMEFSSNPPTTLYWLAEGIHDE